MAFLWLSGVDVGECLVHVKSGYHVCVLQELPEELRQQHANGLEQEPSMAGNHQAIVVGPSDAANPDEELEERLADMEARMTQRLSQLVQIHEDQVRFPACQSLSGSHGLH